jgi:hypothetical protein
MLDVSRRKTVAQRVEIAAPKAFFYDAAKDFGVRSGCHSLYSLSDMDLVVRGIRIHDIDRRSVRVRRDLIEYIRELQFELVARHVSDVRCTDDVRQRPSTFMPNARP